MELYLCSLRHNFHIGKVTLTLQSRIVTVYTRCYESQSLYICIYGFRIILDLNCDYFLKRH
jgi:hypothetical protein